MSRFHQLNFQQDDHAYLEEEDFWDFIFSWYELVRYYELSTDMSIGAHMLDLFQRCDAFFRAVASEPKLKERRRDKAADAAHQLNYYFNRMIEEAHRNGLARENAPNSSGTIGWKTEQAPDESDWN